MLKSYNDIKAQEQRVIELCLSTGRYTQNAKNRLDLQRIAQITRNALTQHNIPMFFYNPDEKK